jgi:mannose-6-phosphate isomerase-like protein (cupin superfamily)
MVPLKYESPQSLDRPKITVGLANSEILRVSVQVVQPKGGETNMHAHPALDSTWLVLSGKAKFYGYGDTLVTEAGVNEGVFIPKGVPYWFEAAGEEPLEILHITAADKTLKNDRVDYAPPVERQVNAATRQGVTEGRGRPPTDEELQAASKSVGAI